MSGTTFTSVTEVDTFVFDARINDLNISPANSLTCENQPGVTVVNQDQITCSTITGGNCPNSGSGRYGGRYPGGRHGRFGGRGGRGGRGGGRRGRW